MYVAPLLGMSFRGKSFSIVHEGVMWFRYDLSQRYCTSGKGPWLTALLIFQLGGNGTDWHSEDWCVRIHLLTNTKHS